MTDYNTTLDEDEIRERVNAAEPLRGTKAWAEHTINVVYEPKIKRSRRGHLESL